MSGKKQINISIECGGEIAFEVAKGMLGWLRLAKMTNGPVKMLFSDGEKSDSSTVCNAKNGRGIESFDVKVLSVPMISEKNSDECAHNCDYGQDKYYRGHDNYAGNWERYCTLAIQKLKNCSGHFQRADGCKEFYGGKPCQHRQETNGQ